MKNIIVLLGIIALVMCAPITITKDTKSVEEVLNLAETYLKQLKDRAILLYKDRCGK